MGRPIITDPTDTRHVLAVYRDHGQGAWLNALLMWYVGRVQASGTRPPDQTIRHLWYVLVKPTLGRMGALSPDFYPLAADGTPKTSYRKDSDVTRYWTQRLSEAVKGLVMQGVTTYRGLGIIDGSRLRHEARPSFRAPSWVPSIGMHHPQVLLFIEKDSLWPVLRQAAQLLGVSAVSGRGYSAHAATEQLYRHIVDAMRNLPVTDEYTIDVLAVTDYDPDGIAIADTIAQQLAECARYVGWPYGRARVTVDLHRLGLWPAQLPPDVAADNLYPMPVHEDLPYYRAWDQWPDYPKGYTGKPDKQDTAIAQWVAGGHGLGADGQAYTDGDTVYGLELDALDVPGLRALVLQSLASYIGPGGLSVIHSDLAKAAVRLAVLARLQPYIDHTVDQYMGHLPPGALDGLVTALAPADPDTDPGTDPEAWPLLRLALAGRSYIDPLADAADLWGPDGPAHLQRLVAEAEPAITPVVLPPTDTP